MLKLIGTDLVISKGYNDQPALRYSEDNASVRFRVGKRVYDKREKDSHRWINLNVKAFGELCERVRKMKLDAGSFIHLEGRYEEDNWQGEDGTKHSVPVIILTEIEYAYTGNGNGNKQNGTGGEAETYGPPEADRGYSQSQPQQNSRQEEMPGSFTGFENFGGANPFFPPTQR